MVVSDVGNMLMVMVMVMVMVMGGWILAGPTCHFGLRFVLFVFYSAHARIQRINNKK
jgi:hypothetical protein